MKFIIPVVVESVYEVIVEAEAEDIAENIVWDEYDVDDVVLGELVEHIEIVDIQTDYIKEINDG